MYLGEHGVGRAALSLPWSWKVGKLGVERLEFLHLGLFFYMNNSGQISGTSHDLTPKWWLSKENPLISRKPRLVKYHNLAR